MHRDLWVKNQRESPQECAFMRFSPPSTAAQPRLWAHLAAATVESLGPLTPVPSPPLVPRGGRGKKRSLGRSTQGGGRSEPDWPTSLAPGCYQAIPTGFQSGSLRSHRGKPVAVSST